MNRGVKAKAIYKLSIAKLEACQLTRGVLPTNNIFLQIPLNETLLQLLVPLILQFGRRRQPGRVIHKANSSRNRPILGLVGAKAQ